MKSNIIYLRQVCWFIVLTLSTIPVFGQGLVSTALKTQSLKNTETSLIECGSDEFIETADKEFSSFQLQTDALLQQIATQVKHHKKAKLFDDLFVIPVVFHIVHRDDEENIPDSVIRNQLRVLNECFRRENADTANLRSDFHDIVSGLNIVFQLATLDPNGQPTSGITRTKTDVRTFGGTLPYRPGQNAEIAQWVNDSMFTNLFRITQTDKGGHDPWDVDEYINIYVGDLRIFEPRFDNFEEILYFGLSTPPLDHENWPDTLLKQLEPFNQGVLMHYNAIGPNNPAKLKAPYTPYNGIVTTGKMLVHEVGHYLGLRHIWGDGGCEMDDYVDDTPRANASSAYDCNSAANTCIDTINGKNLPNMIENYMDYSSADCQNSFTIGQIAVMQEVLNKLRPQLVSIENIARVNSTIFNVYPNPMTNSVNLISSNFIPLDNLNILTSTGQSVAYSLEKTTDGYSVSFEGKSGLYFLKIQFGSNVEFVKIIKQ